MSTTPTPTSNRSDDLHLPPFIPGTELCRLFYEEAVRPIMERHFPGLHYGAARLDNGSDVLGFDTPISMDHGWGPRLNVYVADDEYSNTLRAEIRRILAAELPFEIHGFPTNLGSPGRSMQRSTQRPIDHNVGVGPTRGYFKGIGNPFRDGPIPTEEWLVLPEQQLRAIVRGPVYRDDTGDLAFARERLHWYPHDVWLYLLASVWQRIGQEEAFPGRCGHVGDEVGSLIVAGRLVRDVMRLCFLMEREYAPYAKWFGSAFAQLRCAPRLTPLFHGALKADTWQQRDRHLAAAYEAVAELHNTLALTPPLDSQPHLRYPSRPYLGITAGRFAKALTEQIRDDSLRTLALREHGLIGNTGHWIDSTDALADTPWQPTYLRQYREALTHPAGEAL